MNKNFTTGLFVELKKILHDYNFFTSEIIQFQF
jgi:hypothetical protein